MYGLIGRMTAKAGQRDALTIPEVKATLQRGLPLIATFEDATVTTPVGGLGLG